MMKSNLQFLWLFSPSWHYLHQHELPGFLLVLHLVVFRVSRGGGEILVHSRYHGSTYIIHLGLVYQKHFGV